MVAASTDAEVRVCTRDGARRGGRRPHRARSRRRAPRRLREPDAGVRSIYRFQGAVEDEREVLLVIKTRADRVDALAERLRALHPYEVPELLVLPTAGGLAPYLDWVRAEAAPVSLARALEDAASAFPGTRTRSVRRTAIPSACSRRSRRTRRRGAGMAARSASGRRRGARARVGRSRSRRRAAARPRIARAGQGRSQGAAPRPTPAALARRRSGRQPVVAHVATLPKLEDEINVALVSPPDPSGAQLVVVVESSPSGGARIFQGAIDTERGILEFRVLQSNRSQARRLLRDLDVNEKLAASEAPRESVAALLASAAEAQPGDRALPQQYGEWRTRIARAPAGTPTPGALARAAIDASRRPRCCARSPRRSGPAPTARGRPSSRCCTRWPRRCATPRRASCSWTSSSAARRWTRRSRRRARSALRRPRASALRRASKRSPTPRGSTADGEEAQRCIAAARAFREQPPRDNPVARALLDRALRPILDVLRDEDASSPLVRP